MEFPIQIRRVINGFITVYLLSFTCYRQIIGTLKYFINDYVNWVSVVAHFSYLENKNTFHKNLTETYVKYKMVSLIKCTFMELVS